MEIPIVNRIIDFEANVNALHNSSSLLSQVSGIQKIYQSEAYSFFKWGALILAFIASFDTIIKKLRILIIGLQKHPSQQNQHQHLLDDSSYGSDTDSSTSCSSLSDDEQLDVDDDDDEEEEKEATVEDFRVRGSAQVYIDEQWQNHNMGLRRRRLRSNGNLFSWCELNSCKSVVKLWDNLGLGLGLNVDEDDSTNDSTSMLTIYDMNSQREIQKSASFFRRKCKIPTIVTSSSSSAAVIFFGVENDGEAISLSGWDMRIGSRIPAILAEWRPKRGNIVGVKAGGVEKLYVGDYVDSALMVGDMRKVNSPLEDLTDNDVDTWWDADAVIVTEESFQD